MNTEAIVLMVFSMVMLWGGLIYAVVHLVRSAPVEHEPDREDVLRRIALERDL